MKPANFLSIVLSAMLIDGCASSTPPSSTTESASPTVASSLNIATWNVEHLASPGDLGCKARTAEDIRAMKRYAATLDADIVALQEVASTAAVQQVFPATQWRIIMSGRPDSEPYTCRESGLTSTQQKVAFAVKNGIEVQAVNNEAKLGLALPGLRYGLSITVDSPNGPLDLLNVHMKSGCFEDDYLQSNTEACTIYAEQAPVLERWIATREASGRAYALLGDFNHRISAPYNRLARQLMNQKHSTTIATKQLIGCHPRYPAPIDHIVVGGMNSQSVIASARVHNFDGPMLSDHCAVSATLFENDQPLSSAVVWQTRSKEYRLLSQGVYQQAITALDDTAKTRDNWVVVMDVDETVLDNSAYQRETEKTGAGYSPASWNAWVKREAAGLVPGAKDFIKAVYKKGGKVALITNRNRSLDRYTWNNLQALNIPVSPENTCLVGRGKADKQAVGQANIVNDKDLRRQQIQQIQQGMVACYVPSQTWSAPHHIIMQIGDNIEDFTGITQENANIDALLPELGRSLFLLPNPMYGSWN